VASADLEATHVTCTALAKDLATCLTLMPEVVIGPSFPQDEMRQAAEQLISGLRLIRDNPEALAGEHFDNLLWGEDHVRGWPRSIEAVQAVTRKDLVAWHAARFAPNNALLAVAGDIDAKQLRADLTRGFGGWKKSKVTAPKKLAEPSLKGVRVRLVDKPDQTQSQILVGHLGVAHADLDYLPTLLVNYTLGGGGFASRLQTVVRVKGGKSYGAHSDFERWRTRGAFQASAATRTPETAATLKLLVDEIARMHDQGPTAEDLAAAKANLAGAYPMRFQGPGDVAGAVLAAELHGLGEAYVREYPVRVDAVTLDAARAAAAKRLDPKNLVVVIVGKADEVGPQLDRAGLVYDKVGYLEPISARDRAARAPAAAGTLDPKKTESGKKLLDAALAAKGGEAKLRAIKDLVAVGTVKLAASGQSFDGAWTRVLVPPDRMSVAVNLRGLADIQMVITPEAVFQALNKAQVQDLKPEQAAELREGFWRDHDLILLRHLDQTTLVQDVGKTTVEGKAYDTVVLRPAGGGETRVLLDPKSKMIFRLVYQKGGSTGFEQYGDYRDVEGIKLPFAQHAESSNENLDVTVGEYKINGGVPTGTFDRPKPPGEPPK